MDEAAEIIELTRRLPTHDEISNAAQAAIALAGAQAQNGALTISGPHTGSVQLAPAISELIVDVLGHIARGDMVTIIPTGAMLTTQQAADILNVSRPYLSKLLRDGHIPHIPVGSHRRVRYDDLMAYKGKRDAGRIAALETLARLGQEFEAS